MCEKPISTEQLELEIHFARPDATTPETFPSAHSMLRGVGARANEAPAVASSGHSPEAGTSPLAGACAPTERATFTLPAGESQPTRRPHGSLSQHARCDLASIPGRRSGIFKYVSSGHPILCVGSSSRN